MKYVKFLKYLVSAACVYMSAGCTTTVYEFPDNGMPGDQFGPGGMMGDGSVSDDGDVPSFTPDMSVWNGEMADDADKDAVGTDDGLYHEVNTFDNKIVVTYDGKSAKVDCPDSRVQVHIDGAYVTLDLKTNSVANTEIELKGKSDDGGLKIYGDKKFKLSLSGVELASQRGPAINNQCKKRVFVALAAGTTNNITDVDSYTEDPYYLDSADSEDRKGCLFSEGTLVMSGNGVLIVSGKCKHAIATDKSFVVRPGTTIVIKEAAKNGIHVKGDSDDEAGFTMMGGLIYANIGAEAGKCIKSDMNVDIKGGQLMLNTTGDAIYEADEQDTSSAAGIKTDASILISGGRHFIRSSGSGGKGLNADGEINISGGETNVHTSGEKYTYTTDVDASPKGVKADGDINISGGVVNISVVGKNDGAEGLESKAVMTISGGETYVYAYDDAVNAKTAINVTGGKLYAYSCNNDGIDSNGTLTVSDGVVIATGTSAPESGIDVDSTDWFKIDGGTVLAVGGTLMAPPSSGSLQPCVSYSGMSATKGTVIAVSDASKVLLSLALPRSVNGANFLFSCPGIKTGNAYDISSGGSVSDCSLSWNGWCDGGVLNGGTSVETFTPEATITSIGNGMNGGFGGGPGGGMPGGNMPDEPFGK